MRKRIFLDANIIISGTFFRGNEAKLLSIPDIELYTCDIIVEEVKEVTRRKLAKLTRDGIETALAKIEASLQDFHETLSFNEYAHRINEARTFIKKDKDSKILAAVIHAKPDVFVTGDRDFHTDEIKKIVKVRYTRELLREFL